MGAGFGCVAETAPLNVKAGPVFGLVRYAGLEAGMAGQEAGATAGGCYE